MPAAAPSMRWYGWQILIADGAATIAMTMALLVDSGARDGFIHVPAPVAWSLGGPVVHLANRRPLHALASFGVRLGFAVAGTAGALYFLTGGSISGGQGRVPREPGFAILAGAMLGATAVDAFALATTPFDARASAQTLQSSLVPMLLATPGGMFGGLRGAF